MRFKAFMCASLFACLLVSNSEASILGQMLTFDGIEDLANDNSDGKFVDTTLDGIPDLVQGVVWIDSVNGVNVATATGGSIFAIYSFTLTPTGVLGQFSATPTVGANSVNSMLKRGGLGGADFSTLTTYNAGVGEPGVAVIEIPGSFTNVDWRNTGAAALSAPLTLDFIPSAVVGDFSAFDVDLTLGFDGIDDSHTINILTPVVPIGVFAGVYSVKEHIFGGGVNYLPVTSPAVPGLFPGGTGDVVIDDGSIGSAVATGAVLRGFNFSDAGTYRLNPTPEPAAVLVWAGLAGAAGLVALGRRRLRNV